MQTRIVVLFGALLVSSTWVAQTTSGPFRDVPKDHWAYQAIEDLRQKGILVGYPDEAKRETGTIEGIAEIGPVKPVQRVGEKNTRPLPGAIITIQPEKGGKEIARAKTDSEGRFRLALSPGTYQIVPLAPNPKSRYPRGRSQTVTVKSGDVAKVIVQYDSGIR